MSTTETMGRLHLPIQKNRLQADTPVDARQATAPRPAAALRPPEGAPNVLLILVDDMGFGASSAFGGPCQMPTAERMAAEGVRMTRFHTTALCSPSRQALMTGRNHHSAEMGALAEVATSFPGYTGVRPDDCAPLAQVLRMNGYSTAMFGKHHQTPPWETSPSGPFDRWPTGEGFEKFYGFIGGDTHQYSPALIDGTNPIEPPSSYEEGYHLSEDLVDQTIKWIDNLQALTPDKPWFTYLSFGATHAPHHAPQSYLDEMRGKFDYGYDEQRAQTFARQKELGVIPADAELTAPNDKIPAWKDLSTTDQEVGARLFEAYAAMAKHMDDQVGRLLDTLEARGQLKNTMVVYIMGDNGASAESGAYGTINEMAYQNNVLMTTEDILPRLDEVGGPKSFNHVPSGWAQAMNTPYQWSKIVASHWGGTRTGMIVRYPGEVPAHENRHQFAHLIDVAPTILEYAGIPEPLSVNGVRQRPMEGTSFKYAMQDGDAAERHVTQYFEMAGNRGVYHEGWTAVTQHLLPWPDPDDFVPALTDDVWELYGPDDWTQSNDLAAQMPDKLRELQDRFLIEAAKYNVLPIDDRERERFDPAIAGRPDLMGDRTTQTLRPGMTRLNENTVLNVKNRSFSVTATIETPSDGPARGALIAQGGGFGGWALYFADGLLTYAHNFVGLNIYRVRAEQELSPGAHTVRMEFAYDGGGAGKGGTVTLFCDDEAIGSGRVERTIPALFSFDEGLDVGLDSLDPVVDDYGVHRGEFNGSIEQVVLNTGEDAVPDPNLVLKARFRRQ
ncbi:arylsulfatase [Zhihengliuella flava]|uniref:Arylsulfatase n=1 Tax=Zhihengliuella flava TaxID=1285193 RepID=A0A931DDE6_9MICC|nr:arylsulfatase [Zhihengliuella flava]MBG6085516.1 arylsulfatase [Zhihengliuella flava]